MNKFIPYGKLPDRNIERDHIFQILFTETNIDLDIHKIQDLYNFCSGDEAYIDLADNLFLYGKIDIIPESIYESYQKFLNRLKKSGLFNDKEFFIIKNSLCKFIKNPIPKIKSYREEILDNVLQLMDINKETIH